MVRRTYFLALSLLLGPVIGFAGETPDHSPAFTAVSELTAGFDLLYEQKFAEAREVFTSWQSRNPDQPFAEVAIAASYLFEELSRQGVLTSDFFLNEKKFLRGIDGKPDPERMTRFREALAQARQLARERQKTDPKDGEPLLALTLAAGMESNEESILQKRHLAGLRRTKEANEYAQAVASAESGGHRRLCRARHGKLHSRIAEPRFPVHTLVWWNSRGQETRYGAARQNCRERPLPQAVRQNCACSCRTS